MSLLKKILYTGAAAVTAACLLFTPAGSLRLEAAGITVLSSGTAVTVRNAVIKGSDVVVTASSSNVPSSDDGEYHLFAQECYQLGAEGIEVATAPAAADAVFTFPLNKNTSSSNLFKKFVVVVYKSGVPTAVSNGCYITNPEATATHTASRHDGGGKKGLLQDSALLDGNLNDLTAMGINQVTYNLNVGNAIKPGDISYTYDGVTYHFDGPTIRSYDKIVPQLNAKGVSVTLILLNNFAGDPSLIHPLSYDGLGGSNYYAFNTANDAGVKKLEAFAAFLGERYSGQYGTVDNWIIGNEINARHEWNYITPSIGLDGAAAEYAKALRLFYNGIRSQNANARVYASIDHEWNRADNAALHYPGKAFLNSLNNYIIAEGNIAYGIAHHPYNYDLHLPQVWMPVGHVNHTPNTNYITMENIDVLTDYIQQPTFLAPDGSVRSVLCSEVSYNSNPAYGDEFQQAAAMVYGYLQCVYNQHIDGFFPRETDAFEEVMQGLSLGLMNPDYSHKLAYTWYAKAMDPEIIAQASAIAGVNFMDMFRIR